MADMGDHRCQYCHGAAPPALSACGGCAEFLQRLAFYPLRQLAAMVRENRPDLIGQSDPAGERQNGLEWLASTMARRPCELGADRCEGENTCPPCRARAVEL